MKKKLIWFVPVTVVAISLGIWGCSKDSSNPNASNSPSPGTPAPPSTTVVMMNNAFNPGTLTVSRGTTVTWTNSDGVIHTSTSDTGLWDTGNIGAGSSKGVTFSSAGTFNYHCTIHRGMTGTIIAQ